MADAFATNFAIPGDTNFFQVIWKLTRTLKAAGWIYKCSGDGNTVKETTGVATADLWGGNVNPLTDTYPNPKGGTGLSDTSAGWWVASGPKTVKIPLNANPTGTLLRGEIVTQAVTGATGELFGYVWDTVSSSGWAIIGPQTGTFNNTTANTITGALSLATFAPTGTIVTFNREIMIGKPASDTVDGTIYYVCANAATESTSLFSSIASSASGCTTTVWPGGGGTGNSLPSIAIAIRGAGGNITGSDTWVGLASGLGTGTHAQIGCSNATASSGITADGSFYIASSTATPNAMTGLAFTRLDDTEPGDADPYVWFISQANNLFSGYSATNNTGSNGILWSLSNFISGTATPYDIIGYQARGVDGYTPNRDVSFGFGGTFELDNFGNTYAIVAVSNGSIRMINTPAITAQLVREKMLVYTGGQSSGTFKQIKGRTRWIQATSQGNCLDTFDTKTWIGIIQAKTNVPCLMIGPYDGSSTPQT
ncbi:MAG TPA: hypothetical protein VK890_01930 [Bacteroidia bacterium]|jgi:hypothetical protein|nr:hypothetical protein [Bacteroidia bacterium]